MKYIFTAALIISVFIARAQHSPVAETNEVKISGNVKNTLTLKLTDMRAFKQEELGDLDIKNKKGEHKQTATQMKGVLLKDILDSAGIAMDKHKEYSELAIVLTASDGYKNVYSWNELFNNELGSHVYIITEMDGKPADKISGRILVISMSDINSGRRHLKGLSSIEVRKL